MSTLTKILIVLLSLFSIYLCATIVTYVGTADNYKNAYEQQGKEFAALKEKNKGYEKDIVGKKRQMDEFSLKLDSEVSKLKAEKGQLEQELKIAESAKLDAEEKVKSLTASALNFEKSVGGMEGSLKETRQDLDDARAEGIKLTKNLNEVTASLEEKMAQLAALNAEKKRLLEEKTNLERQISGRGGSVATEPITTVPDSASRAIEMPSVAALKGVITAVEGSIATLSIGEADGVQKGMIFHVIRNDVFICDIKMTEVDTDASAGTLQLLQQQPKVGDIASTTW